MGAVAVKQAIPKLEMTIETKEKGLKYLKSRMNCPR